jgi:hypothetical protein
MENYSAKINERIKLTESRIKYPSIYFGHPVNFYNTDKEKELVEIIQKNFSEYSLENPNQAHHQENYKLWKEELGNGMKYYFDIVLPKMNAGIFLPFEDGMFGAGVFGEAEAIYSKGYPIWQIDLEGSVRNVMKLDYSKKLSIDETRKRVYG